MKISAHRAFTYTKEKELKVEKQKKKKISIRGRDSHGGRCFLRCGEDVPQGLLALAVVGADDLWAVDDEHRRPRFAGGRPGEQRLARARGAV
jgi:hypothetical protein